MIACLDVAYSSARANAACILISDWTSAVAALELTHEVPLPHKYESGQFYRRELPCLLAILGLLPERPAIVVVDAYVWLGPSQTPGLGGHLYAALGSMTPVVGVAKKPFRGAPACEVLRGRSHVPLFVNAAGMESEEAAALVASMHGPFRIPTVLKQVDLLSRRATQ
jgi:deoxyribonuclease V